MKQIVGVRFGRDGHVQCGVCLHDGEHLEAGRGVVLEDERGPVFGRVMWQREQTENCTPESMEGRLPSVRPATEEECSAAGENEELSREAHLFCRDCIQRRGLDMKLVDVEVLLDRSKIIFYFTAPTRIDFRELVKDLVRQYRTRIELRQIGVRHETQKIGAVGNCGMVVCCRRYLKNFAPVTIKMAKEQNLFLNPAKISGICGRLLCCLSFEQENYDAFHRSCPKLGKRYQTDKGGLRVMRTNMFRNTVSAVQDGGQETEMTMEEWLALNPHRAEQTGQNYAQHESGGYDYMSGGASPDMLEKEFAELEDAPQSEGREERHGRGGRSGRDHREGRDSVRNGQ